MTQVFISYSSTAREKVRRLVTTLQSLCVEVWWDQQLGSGEAFKRVIFKELTRAVVVVVCFTSRCVDSPYVQGEADFAIENGKYIPIALEEGALFVPYTQYQTHFLHDFEYSEPHGDWQRFLASLGERLGRPGLASVWPAFIRDDRAALDAWRLRHASDPLAGLLAATPRDDSQRTASGGQTQMEGAGHPSAAPTTPRRVVCVDDDTELLSALTAFLVREGHAVSAYSSSQQAAQMLAKDQPDLLLLDLRMPNMDGFELMRRMRALGMTVPVVLFTSTPHDPAKAAALGASSVVPKPFSSEAIRHVVNATLAM